MTSIDPTHVRRRPVKLPRTAVLVALACAATLVLLFPIYWMVHTSVMPLGAILSKAPAMAPSLPEISFSAYAEAFGARSVGSWLTTSLVVTALSTLLTMFFSVPAGYALSRLSGAKQRQVGYALFLSRTIPATVLILPIYMVYAQLGMLDNVGGLVILNAAVTVPFTTWLLKGTFDSIPLDIEEAAALDGCSMLGGILRIVLPLAVTGIGAGTIYSAVGAWGEYMFAATLIDDPGAWTLTVGLGTYMGEHGTDWSGLMAVAVISVLPMTVLFAALQRVMTSDSIAGYGR